MTSQTNNFDAVSGIYDAVAKLVFGKHIKTAQRALLSELSGANKILVIGGGTGWLLKDLLLVNRTAEIWYVDASQKMLDKARRCCADIDSVKVRFIHGTQNELPDHATFDAAVANFYFDMFSPDSLPVVIGRVKKSMKPGAFLIATDFVHTQSRWHSLLLSTMYMFFGVVSKLEARTLPPWREQLADSGFNAELVRGFYDGFIETRKYVVL